MRGACSEDVATNVVCGLDVTHDMSTVVLYTNMSIIMIQIRVQTFTLVHHRRPYTTCLISTVSQVFFVYVAGTCIMSKPGLFATIADVMCTLVF